MILKKLFENFNGKLNEEVNYDYSSTQVDIPKDIADKILELTLSIAKEDLYTNADEEGKYGRELLPHITIKYGLETTNPDDVEKIIHNYSEPNDINPIIIELKGVSLFSKEDKPYDVVKVDVESAALNTLHEMFSKLPNADENPKYVPHLTIAYVKKGVGKKYEGNKDFDGLKFQVNSFTFKGKDKKDREIFLSEYAEEVKESKGKVVTELELFCANGDIIGVNNAKKLLVKYEQLKKDFPEMVVIRDAEADTETFYKEASMFVPTDEVDYYIKLLHKRGISIDIEHTPFGEEKKIDESKLNESGVDRIIIISTDGLPAYKASFKVSMRNGNVYSYEAETSPYIMQTFMNQVDKKFYGRAINTISPYILNYKTQGN